MIHLNANNPPNKIQNTTHPNSIRNPKKRKLSLHLSLAAAHTQSDRRALCEGGNIMCLLYLISQLFFLNK